MSRDADDNEVHVGDTVMLALTSKSAGISWKRCVVSRLTEKSFWHMEQAAWRRDGKDYESGPRKLGNCIVVKRG